MGFRSKAGAPGRLQQSCILVLLLVVAPRGGPGAPKERKGKTMRGKTARILLVLILIFACLVTTAASCDPDPDGGADSTTGWSAEEASHATETYGAEQWHAQLTALAEPVE